jgi:hypothetical protein
MSLRTPIDYDRRGEGFLLSCGSCEPRGSYVTVIQSRSRQETSGRPTTTYEHHYGLDQVYLVSFALRAAYQSSIGTSPATLIFGRDMFFPIKYVANWKAFVNPVRGLTGLGLSTR